MLHMHSVSDIDVEDGRPNEDLQAIRLHQRDI